MAPPDRKPPPKPDGKPWHQAALGGALMALGGALFGLGRKSDTAKQRTASSPVPKERPRGAAGKAGVASKAGLGGKAGAKAKQRESSKPQHWPPPSAKDAKRPRQQTEDGRPEHIVAVNATSEKLGYEVKDTRAGILAVIMVVARRPHRGVDRRPVRPDRSLSHRVDAHAAPLTPAAARSPSRRPARICRRTRCTSSPPCASARPTAQHYAWIDPTTPARPHPDRPGDGAGRRPSRSIRPRQRPP